MIIYYEKPVTFEFDVDMDKLLNLILERNLGDEEEFAINDFGDNIYWYLEELGLKDADEYLSDYQCDILYDEVYKMLEKEEK